MRISLMSTHGKINDSKIVGTTVIMIDVLRASSSIITAVKNGCSKVIPAQTPGEASALAQRLGGDCILAGERDGVMISGFQIGNSPLDFKKEAVFNKTIVMSTTNGTSAIQCAIGAASLLVGAMINCTAVAKKAIRLGNDVLILCAGTRGEASLDDFIAAGSIIRAIERHSKNPVEKTDMCLCCAALYEDFLQNRLDLSQCRSYSELKALGFERDLEYCLQTDVTDVVPCFANGVLM